MRLNSVMREAFNRLLTNNHLNYFFNLQVCHSISPALRLSIRNSFFLTITIPTPGFRFFFCKARKPISYFSRRDGRNKTQIVSTSNSHSGIGSSLVSRFSYIWEKKDDIFAELSLQDLLKTLGCLPDTVRRFWRSSTLKPQDFLEILLGFEAESRKLGVEAEKVESLFKLFNWAANQSRDFVHDPQSYKIMVTLFIQAGRFREADSLLKIMEMNWPSLGSHEFYCEIIERYIDACELESSIVVYHRAKDVGLVLSKSCYRALLDLLIQREKTQLAWRLYMDMLEAGYVSSEENPSLEYIIGNLCRDGKIQDARNLIKKVMDFGVQPSQIVLDKIADGYCDKKDFEDLMNFLTEHKSAPASHVCNKIISSRCWNVGTEEALSFLRKLEAIGFVPDEITFGILVCSSCQEGKLKNAFIFVSDLLSRNLKPTVYIYNALISAIFKRGMGEHAIDVFHDMIDRGITPNASTFRVMLAGYCKERKFDEVRLMISEMVKYGLVLLSPMEDALSKAFVFLDLEHLGVKVKRDTGAGISRAEFFDALGNGLYLEADLDEYESTIMGILDNSMIPNFNLVVTKECRIGDVEASLRAKSELVQWGQKLSLSSYSKLLKGLCSSQSYVIEAIHLFEEMVEWDNHLDQASLNLLIQTLCKKGMIYKARLILGKMLQRELHVENKTYTAMIWGFSKEESMTELKECWKVARKGKWVPEPQDWKPLLSCLCKRGMIKKALELLDSMVENYPRLISDICNTFIKKVCLTGFSNIGCVLVEVVLGRGLVLDHAAYNHLITGFCNEKKFHQAFRILDIMLEKNMTLHVNMCKLLIPHLCQSNLMEKAMVLKQISLSEQSSDSSPVQNTLLNGLCKIGKLYEATAELQHMLLRGIDIWESTFDLMLSEYYRGNNFSLALELLCVMLRRNVSLSISGYRTLVRMMCMQCQMHNALRLKNVMLRETKYPQLVIYNILIFYLFRMGSSLMVEKLLDEMLEKHLIFDEVTCNFLIYGYYKCKDASKSVVTLNTMIDKNMRPSNRSFRMVIDYLCGNGRLEKALELSKLMEFRGWMHGSVFQNTLVLGLLSSDRLRKAEQFLGRMQEKGLSPNNVSYDYIIKRFCEYGRLKMAVELLNVMLKKGNLPSDISYNMVITGCCIHKDFEKALDFHAEMLHKNLVPSVESCNALVCGLCVEGKAYEAERLLGIMLQLGQTPTRDMYQSLVDRYYLDNNLHKVCELLHQMQHIGYVPDFKTHWSLVSNLSNMDCKNNSNNNRFLSQLLSHSGFPVKDSNIKGGKPSL